MVNGIVADNERSTGLYRIFLVYTVHSRDFGDVLYRCFLVQNIRLIVLVYHLLEGTLRNEQPIGIEHLIRIIGNSEVLVTGIWVATGAECAGGKDFGNHEAITHIGEEQVDGETRQRRSGAFHQGLVHQIATDNTFSLQLAVMNGISLKLYIVKPFSDIERINTDGRLQFSLRIKAFDGRNSKGAVPSC